MNVVFSGTVYDWKLLSESYMLHFSNVSCNTGAWENSASESCLINLEILRKKKPRVIAVIVDCR